MNPLFNDLVPIGIPLEKIYLDPNNPRFVSPEWNYVSVADIDKKDVQETTQKKLIDDFLVDSLRRSIEVNGYLQIDRVIVREYATGKFVVLEGNRRICAAKMVSAINAEGGVVDQKVVESLSMIPCLQYTGADQSAAWVFQGLRHITGIMDWSAYNKAKMLVEQMEKEHLSLTDVSKRFGLTPHGAGQWVRGYYAFKQAKESSDYTEEIDEKAYPYLQELFNRSSAKVREWLEWDERSYSFANALNFNEFLGWLYPRDNSENEDNAVLASKGEWGKRRLARRDDIRTIAFFITEAPDMFHQFRVGAPLEQCYSMALQKKYEAEAKEKADPVADVFDAIKHCTKELENIPFKVLREPEAKKNLLEALSKLEVCITSLKSV